jgi:hypothetical protein
MKPVYWKYTFDISAKQVVVKRHIVEGNNINHLKLPKDKSKQKTEIVDRLNVSIPLEDYEVFKKWTDWGTFSVSEKFGETSLGFSKRLNQEVVNNLRKELTEKYPLTLI